tara:strand:+ start:932 stop:1081 length:150 start_codon:yes stop_codon:yes gene_type:complete
MIREWYLSGKNTKSTVRKLVEKISDQNQDINIRLVNNNNKLKEHFGIFE